MQRPLPKSLIVLLGSFISLGWGATISPAATSPDPRFSVENRLYADDFQDGIGNWQAEWERGGNVKASGGTLFVDAPAGATLWFRPRLEGPILIEYDARVVVAGGANDRLSDLNCFWMAHEAAAPEKFPGGRRSGKFADYNTLLTYYVGLGGNGNATSRFRRYIGDPVKRPLLPEHDLKAPSDLLTANKFQRLQIIAAGRRIAFYRDGTRLFELDDAAPYESGWFAFRTVTSRQEFRNFRVYRLRLNPANPTTPSK